MDDFQKFLDEVLKNIVIEAEEVEPIVREYDVYEEVRKQIISERMIAQLTQKELSENTGVTQANLSKIEKGLSRPTIDTLVKIAKGLNKRLVIRFDELEEGIEYD